MSKYEDLVKQREALDRQIKEMQHRDKTEAIEKIKSLIQLHNITAAEVFTRNMGSGQSYRKVPPKYRNPQTDELWTGRGKAPLWIAGKDRELFLIKEPLQNPCNI